MPSATVADTANALAPLEPLHLVGAAGEPAVRAGAGNVGLIAPNTLSQPVGFYKDRGGIVHLEGFAKSGTDGFVFTLPLGYRPQSGITQIFESGGNADPDLRVEHRDREPGRLRQGALRTPRPRC